MKPNGSPKQNTHQELSAYIKLKKYSKMLLLRPATAGAIVLWITTFLYVYLGSGTVFVARILVGLVAGTLLFMPSVIAALVVGYVIYFVWALFRSASAKAESWTLALPLLLLSLYYLVGGILSSTASARLEDFFGKPAPQLSSPIQMNGTYGVDGAMWSFSSRMETEKLQDYVLKSGYRVIVDMKGRDYWERRINARTGAGWQVGDNYTIFARRESKSERLIFAGKTNEMVQLVYCSYHGGL